MSVNPEIEFKCCRVVTSVNHTSTRSREIKHTTLVVAAARMESIYQSSFLTHGGFT